MTRDTLNKADGFAEPSTVNLGQFDMNTKPEFDSSPAMNACWDVYMNRERAEAAVNNKKRKDEYAVAARKFLKEIVI